MGLNFDRTIESLLEEREDPIDYSQTLAFESMYANGQNFDFTDVLRGIWNKSTLSNLFFSAANIKHLDEQIRYEVYLISNKQLKLGPQDPVELVIIMRSIFLNYSANVKCHITKQIARLNNLVIQATATPLYVEAVGYLSYLKRANEGGKHTIPQPLNVNNAGIKTLEVWNALGF